MDEAIGDPQRVRDFVTTALANLFGVQVTKEHAGYGIVSGNLPPQLLDLLPASALIKISFESPTPEGYHYLGRNHRFVEQLCQLVMANTLARQGKRAARAAAIRTRHVTTKTTLLLFRCRNVISRGRAAIVSSPRRCSSGEVRYPAAEGIPPTCRGKGAPLACSRDK